MTAIKLVYLAFAGACLVLYTSADSCTEGDINTCLTNAGSPYLENYVPFSIPDENLDAYCTVVDTLKSCIDTHRAWCWPQFGRLVQYAAREKMGLYICADRAKYKLYRDAMVDEAVRDKWKNCNNEVGIGDYNGLELTKKVPVCDNLAKYSTCLRKYTDESAKDYIETMGQWIMNDFDLYYHCNREKVCPAEQIEACRAYNPAMQAYGFPLILDIPAAALDGFCGAYPYYDSCVSSYADHDCTFEISDSFQAYYGMARAICDQKSDYSKHYSLITDAAHRAAWTACTTASGIDSLNGKEDEVTMCKKLATFVECYGEAVSDADEAAQDFIKKVAGEALSFYNKHYQCAGTSTMVSQSILQMLAILTALWSAKSMLNGET